MVINKNKIIIMKKVNQVNKIKNKKKNLSVKYFEILII